MLGSDAGCGLTCACEELVSVNNPSDSGTEHAGPTSSTIGNKTSGPGDVFVSLFWEPLFGSGTGRKRTDTGVSGLTKK